MYVMHVSGLLSVSVSVYGKNCMCLCVLHYSSMAG